MIVHRLIKKGQKGEALPVFSFEDGKLGGWTESLLKMFWRSNARVVKVDDEIQRRIQSIAQGQGRKLPEVRKSL